MTSLKIVSVTPDMAMSMLEINKHNRPLAQHHVDRIASQIKKGKWKFNGDTIKISSDGSILDGQHRLWAVVEAQMPIETIVVNGIERAAFATIDTIRKPRNLGDTVALSGQTRYRTIIGAALAWMIRYERGVLLDYKANVNRIENSDIEAGLAKHPGMVKAVERIMPLRNIGNTGLIGFLYYITAAKNPDLAERMVNVLIDPGTTGITDPFFKLRSYFITDHHKLKNPLVTIAVGIKALNAAHRGERMQQLKWITVGKTAEKFPKLSV